MKKLVVFKKKSVKQEGPTASPKPVSTVLKKPMPSNKPGDPVFDENKVPTPPPTRSLPKFKERRDYIAILQYRPGLKKHSDYQKLGFKSEGGYLEAAIEADKMAKMLGKAIAVDLYEIRKRELCRVLAVYEVTSFQDWEKENTVEASANKHLKEALKKMKTESTPITYVRDVKVRG